jgi:hypothetical protein
MPNSPRLDYRDRLEARQATAADAARREGRLAQARLAVFVAGAGIIWLVLATPALTAWWIAAVVTGFIGLVVMHDRARRAHQRAMRGVRFYEGGLARLDYDFAGSGRAGSEFLDADHPYSDHLDLFGRGSLFELLSNAQTDAGVATLAAWLGAPAAPETIRGRQTAVTELAPRVDLREDLAVLGPDAHEGLDPESLARWGSAQPELAALSTRIAALVLALATVASAFAIPSYGIGPFALCAILELGFSLPFRSRTRRIIHAVRKPLRNLALLSELLQRIERESFEAPTLLELRAELETHGVTPSVEIARLRRLVDMVEQRQNQLFAPVAPFLLWTTQLAFAIEAWHADCGPHLGNWMQAVGELEALCDLAGFAHEHPDDPFPTIVEDGPLFDAQGLGHPLLPDDRSIRNDVRLDADCSLFVVSGSNMSGKSTLLRTIGTNAVLALAGGPVRATQLSLSPLSVGASIVVQDSLQDGASRFYAEITRLRRIVDLCGGSEPLLFLLDEILAGTNSHDRGIGAAAVVRGLVHRGAIGLLTTHDLALAKIADDLGARARNVHFEDQLHDGEMRFDYRLREGVVTHSNALQLMRAVGLNVEGP